jgi:hypothetical protein
MPTVLSSRNDGLRFMAIAAALIWMPACSVANDPEIPLVSGAYQAMIVSTAQSRSASSRMVSSCGTQNRANG